MGCPCFLLMKSRITSQITLIWNVSWVTRHIQLFPLVIRLLSENRVPGSSNESPAGSGSVVRTSTTGSARSWSVVTSTAKLARCSEKNAGVSSLSGSDRGK